MSARITRARRSADKAAKTLARDGDGGLGGVFVRLPDGERGFAWSAAEVGPDDLIAAAVAMLAEVEAQAATGALGCEGCADRWRRTSAALAALRPTGAPAKHGH